MSGEGVRVGSERPSASRNEITRRVMRAMAKPDFAQHFEVRRDDGSIPVLIAMDTDRVSEVAGRIEAQGGRANVVVGNDTGFHVLGFERSSGLAFGSTDDHAEVHQDINMAMLIAFIGAQSSRVARFRIRMAGVDTSVKRADEILVPA